MNEFVRKILINKIRNGIEEASLVGDIEHPSLTGKLREIVIDNLIIPLLNNHYSTGTGKIIDYKGAKSKEIDVCIYSKNLHPPFFFSQNEKLGIFPIESVLKCIEIKSIFNKQNLKDAFDKFTFLENNLHSSPGYHDKNDMPLNHIFLKQTYDFFAFRIDSQKYSPELILKLYSQIDPNWDSNPLLTSICIAGKGWVCHTARGWYHMPYDRKNKVNEEIIGYLCALLQDLPKTEQSRGIPRIGYYLTNTYKMDKIKQGKKIKNTWKNDSIIFSNTDLNAS